MCRIISLSVDGYHVDNVQTIGYVELAFIGDYMPDRLNVKMPSQITERINKRYQKLQINVK